MLLWRRWLPIALLILQPVLFFWRALIAVTVHIPYDIASYHYPTLAYISDCLRHGWWPWWDPYTYGGMPLHADPQAQIFYPPAWLAIALGRTNLFYWVEWLDAFHMMLGGIFAYVLLRRMDIGRPAALMGASIYQLGGFFASQACHLGAICAGAWLPLAILSVHRRWFAPLVAAISMSILCGFAATTIVVAGATLLYAVTQRRVLHVLAAFAMAALVCAVQLIPLIQLTSWSIASLRSEWLTAWGTPPQALMSLAAPGYYGIFDLAKYRLPFNFTLLYVYQGIVPLILLAAAPFCRKAWLFLGLTIVCAVWMLGEHTPVYGLVFGLLPGLIRGASYAFYAMMAFGLFAGITAAVVFDRLRLPRAILWTLTLITSADLIVTGSNRPMNTTAGRLIDPDLTKLHSELNGSRIDYADIWSPGITAASMMQLPTTDGNIPFMPRRIYRLRSLFCATTPNPKDVAIAGAASPIFRRNLPVNRPDSPLLRMVNTSLVDGRRVPNPLPRFYLVPNVRGSSGSDETFRMLSESSFDPANEAIVEGLSTGARATGKVAVRSYTPDRIELATDANGSGFLATSESFYPGWQATVNGNPQPLLMTNGAFRGLEVPAGQSTIVMSYHPANLGWYALISLAAIAGTFTRLIPYLIQETENVLHKMRT